MIYSVFLLLNVFIPCIYSRATFSSDNYSVNDRPWDAYEYANRISMQLSVQLSLNMNRYPESLQNFNETLGGAIGVQFYNGTAEYNSIHQRSNDLIREGSFNVQTSEDKIIVVFAPNFRNFSVTYNLLDDKGINWNETFIITYDHVPINITIERWNDDGNINSKIDYRGSLYSHLSFGEDYYKSHSNEPEHMSSLLSQFVIPELHLFDKLLDHDNFKAKLCNLFELNSQFLQPQLENIVKSLPFPTQNMTSSRWNQIIQKVNEVGLRTLYTKEYEYAESITKRLASNLAEAGKLKKWPVINIPIPSNVSNIANVRLKVIYANGFEFLDTFKSPFIKEGSFFIQTLGNMTIIRFTPNFHKYVIGYSLQYGGLNGKLGITYKNIPINIEIKHRNDTGYIKANVLYDGIQKNDYTIFVKLDDTITDYTIPNYLIGQFHESTEFRRTLCDIFESGSSFVQEQLSFIGWLPFPGTRYHRLAIGFSKTLSRLGYFWEAFKESPVAKLFDR